MSKKKEARLTVRAGDLRKALAVVIGRKRTSFDVTLAFRTRKGELLVAEATYGESQHAIPASGSWRGAPRVEGQTLRKLAATYEPNDLIDLLPEPHKLWLLRGNSSIPLVRRDDGTGDPFKKAPIPQDPRHTGPVEVPEDPKEKRVERDATWAFSARMPVPQHRDPEEGS